MLLETTNSRTNGKLYIAILEVTSRSGGLYDYMVFYKRANSAEEALRWYEKVKMDVENGKWNIHNYTPNFQEFLGKNYNFYGFMSVAGQDTIDIAWVSKKIHQEWVKDNNDGTSEPIKYPCEQESVEPDLLVTGGWDPHIECKSEGGMCTVSWNCGTRNHPEDCEFNLKYSGKPWVFHTHPSPGTVSSVTYYIWRWPDGWKVLKD